MTFYCVQVAMGQDHQQSTFDLIAEIAHEGGWLCLNNLHLVANWLPALEKVVYDVTFKFYRIYDVIICRK